MKILLLATVVCSLYTGSLPAQSGNEDTLLLAKQRESLKQALAISDRKLEDRQQQWLAAQNKKLKYDTIGLAQYRAEMYALKQERKQQEIAFIKEHPGYLVSLDALTDVIGHLPEDIRAYRQLYKGLDKKIRNSGQGRKLQQTIDTYMAVAVGAKAPAFTAPDTSGNLLRLADFRGKYLLIDFWASWCGPCREENPAVVAAYRQFSPKNFTILSVSLDQPGKKDAWLKAIQDDQLAWSHVSDLQYWNNAVAKLYGVRSIPQNFLLDPKGRIIAANLRGEALRQKLEELLD